jgi:hypothetical protein
VQCSVDGVAVRQAGNAEQQTQRTRTHIGVFIIDGTGSNML